jgi:predicted N-acetyltransferase YhbS
MSSVGSPLSPSDRPGPPRRVQRVVDPMRFTSPAVRLPFRRGSVEYCLGTEADHEAIYQTLLHIFHAPDRETFLGALSDPSYLPEHRLLAKVEGRVVSHVHLTEREIRYGTARIPLSGIMWVGTLPEFRGLGFAQNLMRLAEERARASGRVVQALTTSTPQFYRALGWGICGRQSHAKALSRNLPPATDGPLEGKGGFWQVRPWRQVELGDLMSLYDAQYATVTGSVVRTEEYWRWMIGRKYAHVIWVACKGDAVKGYAFVKDHKILEIAYDPAHPFALTALLGRVRAEALERAYPEVILHAPVTHPAMDAFRAASGKIVDQDVVEGQVSMYHIPELGRFLKSILPELERRAVEAGAHLPLELGITSGDRRWLIHLDLQSSRIEPDKLSRRHLTLSPSTLVRLLMGQVGIEGAALEEGFVASTATAIDAARIIFPPSPVWRSPLDAATA